MRVDTAQRITQWCWKPPTDRSGNDLSDQSSQSAEHVVVNYMTKEPEHLPRANDHDGRNAEKWCWRCRRGIQETVKYHKVSLERIRDKATAKEPVEKKVQKEPQPRSK